MIKKLQVLIVFALLSAVSGFAQDIHFSQYDDTPQLINPGSAGVYNGYVRAIANYKNQWMAMGNAYNTEAASIDFPILKGKKENRAHLGLGLNFFNDKAGDAKIGLTAGNLCIAGILPVTRLSVLSLGLSAGAGQFKADYNALQWATQYDGKGFDQTINSNEPLAFTSYVYPDISAGIYYEYFSGKNTMSRNEQRRIAIGFAYYHINKPEQKYFTAIERMYSKYVVSFNGDFDVTGSHFSVAPTFACFIQGKSNEFDLGVALRYRMKNSTKVTGFITESGLALGAHYRFGDAFIPQLIYDIGNFKIALCYDINISTYAQVTHKNGGAEISLKYIIMRGAKWQDK